MCMCMNITQLLNCKTKKIYKQKTNLPVLFTCHIQYINAGIVTVLRLFIIKFFS